MKRAFILMGLCGLFGEMSAMSAESQVRPIEPEVLRAVCAQAVERENTETRRTVVSEVWPTTYTDTTISCVVDGKLVEGSGLKEGPGYITVSPVRYRVQVDLQTKKADIVRTDPDGAKQAALDALADKLITLKATAITSGSTTYAADVAGKKCVVEVSGNASDGVAEKWVAKQVKCH